MNTPDHILDRLTDPGRPHLFHTLNLQLWGTSSDRRNRVAP